MIDSKIDGIMAYTGAYLAPCRPHAKSAGAEYPLSFPDEIEQRKLQASIRKKFADNEASYGEVLPLTSCLKVAKSVGSWRRSHRGPMPTPGAEFALTPDDRPIVAPPSLFKLTREERALVDARPLVFTNEPDMSAADVGAMAEAAETVTAPEPAIEPEPVAVETPAEPEAPAMRGMTNAEKNALAKIARRIQREVQRARNATSGATDAYVGKILASIEFDAGELLKQTR
jgi:hypothetical protein